MITFGKGRRVIAALIASIAVALTAGCLPLEDAGSSGSGQPPAIDEIGVDELPYIVWAVETWKLPESDEDGPQVETGRVVVGRISGFTVDGEPVTFEDLPDDPNPDLHEQARNFELFN